MASKELIDSLALAFHAAPDDADAYDFAHIALSTILAALQEPTGEMKKVWDDDMSDWIDERIEDPYHPWKIMLAASALGEQSE